MDAERYNLWKPDYAVDVEEIDSQHRKFFEYCARLIQLADESANGNHTNADLINLFFKLRKYAFKHFVDEEDIMAKYGYPKLVTHVQEHNKYFSSIFIKIDSEYNIFGLDITAKMNEESGRIARFLADFAAGWLEKHIFAWDKLLAAHVNNRKR